MAETRGLVLVVVALIGGAATVIAALVTTSGSETAAPPAAPPMEATSTTTPTIQPGPSAPEPFTTEQVAPPVRPVSSDLGASRPITRPACDGSFVVVVGSAIEPSTYRTEVQNLLNAYPDSEYLRTSDTCSSLRARSGAGNPIYGVYYGPFGSREEACRARNAQGGESYVKILDTVTDPALIIEC